MRTIIMAIFIGLLLSSSTFAGEQEVQNMLTALEKLRAATQVGVNYSRYYELLGDAKFALNALERTEPHFRNPEGGLERYTQLSSLGMSFTFYELAGRAWKTLLETSGKKARKKVEDIRDHSWRDGADSLDSAYTRLKKGD